MKVSHEKWVENCLATGDYHHEDKWSKSIAVGSKDFIEKTKTLMGALAIGRKLIETGKSFQLRESQISYGNHLGGEKNEIESENAFGWS